MPTIDLPATRLQYARAGAGEPPLVFVHGALCDHADWRHQLAHFGASHAVLAPDLHGHGGSAQTPGRIRVEAFAEDVLALCDAEGMSRVVLVGHSMGCRVLLQAWSQSPERIAALVFVDGAYLVPQRPGPLAPAERERQALAAHERAAALYRDVEPAQQARQGFSQMFFDPRFDALRNAIVEKVAALPPHVARELMPGFAAWDVLHLERVLATVSVPVLVFASTFMNAARQRVSLSPGVQTPWLEALQALVPQAEVHRHHGAGHFLMLEQPDAVNAAIDDFLRRHGLGA
jgi:pimeloyl-ACP methyl ester carboxylesterase